VTNLEQMLKRHDKGDYYIHHWTGFCKPSVSARQAARKIAARMNETLRRLANEGEPPEGFIEMCRMAKFFIADLQLLLPAEFEKLQKLIDEELMNRVPYTPTDTWLAAEGRILRFEN